MTKFDTMPDVGSGRGLTFGPTKHIEPPPEGVPLDIWTVAMAAFKEMATECEGADDRLIIARAIMAERERCAGIVFSSYRNRGELCYKICAEIRNRGAA